MVRITPVFSTIIVPREDTGLVQVLCPYPFDMVDLAVFSVYDKLTHQTVMTKVAEKGMGNMLCVFFNREDTYNLDPKEYYWDIKIYTNPRYDEEGTFIEADQINSLFSAYKLPKFKVKEVPNHG